MRIINYADVFRLEKSVEKKQIANIGKGIEHTHIKLLLVLTSGGVWYWGD